MNINKNTEVIFGKNSESDFKLPIMFCAANGADTDGFEVPYFKFDDLPDMEKRQYEHGGGTLCVFPSEFGAPTVFDRDVLIYCINLWMSAREAELRRGKIKINPSDLLLSLNRTLEFEDFEWLEGALTRLCGSQFVTEVECLGANIQRSFSFIEEFNIVDFDITSGIEIKLSDVVREASVRRDVVRLPGSYFQLRSPLDRLLHEIILRYSRDKTAWSVSLDALKRNLATSASLDELRARASLLVEAPNLTDYKLTFENDILSSLRA